MSYVDYPANFDGNDLNTVPGLSVLSTNPYHMPKRSLTTYPIARTNKSRTTSGFYTEREIIVRVSISRPTRALLEASIDILMAMLDDIEAPLIIRQSGSYRSYTCTLADHVEYQAGGSYIEYDLVFACSDMFGYELAPTLLTQITNFTSAQKVDLVTFGGNAPTQAPVITLTYSAITGGTSATVEIGNGMTGQRVAITRTWAAGDIIEIDSKNETVKVNGAEIAYTGAMPRWAPGPGYITYSDTFTARTWSRTDTVVRRYK